MRLLPNAIFSMSFKHGNFFFFLFKFSALNQWSEAYRTHLFILI